MKSHYTLMMEGMLFEDGVDSVLGKGSCQKLTAGGKSKILLALENSRNMGEFSAIMDVARTGNYQLPPWWEKEVVLSGLGARKTKQFRG